LLLENAKRDASASVGMTTENQGKEKTTDETGTIDDG